MTTKEIAAVYDTLLSIPGMNETVKIDLKISRKTVLILTQVIERGLSVKDDNGLSDVAGSATTNELKTLAGDCLEKAGLTDLSQRLKGLLAK